MVRPKKTPQRMCVGCGEMKEKRALVRVVRTPDGQVLIDNTGKKSGRGAYLCPDHECLTKAIKAKRLEKALRHPVAPEIIETLLTKLGDG